jgi:hypothetical protein
VLAEAVVRGLQEEMVIQMVLEGLQQTLLILMVVMVVLV